MKKNSSLTQKTVFIRVAAFLTAAMTLLCAVACSQDSTGTSSEPTLTELKIEELDKDMTDFLIRFSDWYYVDEGEKNEYDSAKAGGGETNILRCIIADVPCAEFSKYPVSEPKVVYDAKHLDPKKWAKKSGGSYIVYESKDVDWIAVNIFNATEKDIETMRAQGEKNEWFYLDDGKYYAVIGGVGDPLTEYTFESAKTDGTVYYVTYHSDFYNGETREFFRSYTAELQQKNIDGKDYWTLNKFEQTSDK
ncbi:MAG: hypothetical protein IIZ08_07950 [Clostridia bacterium]|nr:hypothetical protein [Clostridia bacterium]